MCENLAKYRFSWLNGTDQFVCEDHKPFLEEIIRTVETKIQITPLSPTFLDFGITCSRMGEDD